MDNAMATIEGVVIRETAKAVFANLNGCHSSVWIPKSQMTSSRIDEEDLDDGLPPLRHLTAEIPVWLWNKLPLNETTAIATQPW
jgi:hypothetical protein